MPTIRLHVPPCLPAFAGVNPERLLSGFAWSDTIWRQGELAAQFKGKTVLLGVDDMDVFKGIELKLQVGFLVVLSVVCAIH